MALSMSDGQSEITRLSPTQENTALPTARLGAPAATLGGPDAGGRAWASDSQDELELLTLTEQAGTQSLRIWVTLGRGSWEQWALRGGQSKPRSLGPARPTSERLCGLLTGPRALPRANLGSVSPPRDRSESGLLTKSSEVSLHSIPARALLTSLPVTACPTLGTRQERHRGRARMWGHAGPGNPNSRSPIHSLGPVGKQQGDREGSARCHPEAPSKPLHLGKGMETSPLRSGRPRLPSSQGLHGGGVSGPARPTDGDWGGGHRPCSWWHQHKDTGKRSPNAC